MHLNINLAKLYLMLDFVDIHFNVPKLNMWNLILHVFTYLDIFCLFGILYMILIFVFILLYQYAFLYGNTIKELTFVEKKPLSFIVFYFNCDIRK